MPARLPTLLRHAVFALLSGLIITIAVSWSLAAYLPHRNWRHFALGDVPVQLMCIHEYRTFGAIRRHWFMLSPLAKQVFPEPIAQSAEFNFSRDYSPTPRWTRWGELDAEVAAANRDTYGCEHATGWPMHALWYSIYGSDNPRGPIPVTGGIFLHADPKGRWNLEWMSSIRALPLRPIWPGLLANTLLYATLSWLLFGGYRRARASLRLRRNHCPRCNYDLRGLTGCPECGWNRPS